MPISKVQQIENFLPDKYLYEVQFGIYKDELLDKEELRIVALEPLAKKINDITLSKNIESVVDLTAKIEPPAIEQALPLWLRENATPKIIKSTAVEQPGSDKPEQEKESYKKQEKLDDKTHPNGQRSDKNITTPEEDKRAESDAAKKKTFGEKLLLPKEKQGVEAIFRATNPLKIYDSDQKLSQLLARAYFCTATVEVNQSRSVPNIAGEFVVCFTREGSSTTNQKFSPDIALVARIYLLVAISKLKVEMRDCLQELAERFENVKKININKNDGNQLKQRGDRWIRRFEKLSLYMSDMRKLANLLSETHDSEKAKKWTISTKNFIAASWWNTEHFLSVFVKKIIGNFQCLTLLWISVVLVIAGLFWGLLGPVNGFQGLSSATVSVLKVALAAQLALFALLALNFKNIEDRVHDKILEEANAKLSNILSELTQTNANVASLNTNPEPAGHVPEVLLRHFDEVLHVKEAVTGLEKVILARQRNVSAQVSHIKEHQERARRAATAAAGGVFTGFFTFEVGERVFKFMHLIHGQDERSMFFWLTTEAQQFANPDLVNAQKRLPPELLEAYKNCVADGGKGCTTVQQTLSPVQIREHFMKQYQQSEMHAYGLLLAITLVVSLIAAAIGWRKPAEEQAGTHGGHH